VCPFGALRFLRVAQDDGFPGKLAAGEEEVDGGVGDGEQGSEGGGDAFEALHGLLVIEHAGFELGEAAGLTVADNLFHLGFEDGQVGEDDGFEIGHKL
jgi:hypothetical protein